jgi:hypothetical protein
MGICENNEELIYQKELFAILVAAHRAPSNCNLRIRVDNTVAISGIARRGANDVVYRRLVEKITSIFAKKNITPALRYISSSENPADKPSRPD